MKVQLKWLSTLPVESKLSPSLFTIGSLSKGIFLVAFFGGHIHWSMINKLALNRPCVFKRSMFPEPLKWYSFLFIIKFYPTYQPPTYFTSNLFILQRIYPYFCVHHQITKNCLNSSLDKLFVRSVFEAHIAGLFLSSSLFKAYLFIFEIHNFWCVWLQCDWDWCFPTSILTVNTCRHPYKLPHGRYFQAAYTLHSK